jgi:hypothetical protein
MFWTVEAQSTLTHGIELAKATVGYDFRVDSQVAFAPIVGVDATLFDWQYSYGAHALTTMSRAQVGTFVFAGLQARFDVGSSERLPPVTEPAAARR